MIDDKNPVVIMIIIIDDLHNSFNFDNYHDGWLIGDHIMMSMDRDCTLCRLIHVTDWLWRETWLMIYWW